MLSSLYLVQFPLGRELISATLKLIGPGGGQGNRCGLPKEALVEIEFQDFVTTMDDLDAADTSVTEGPSPNRRLYAKIMAECSLYRRLLGRGHPRVPRQSRRD
jgi:hypothetical protein